MYHIMIFMQEDGHSLQNFAPSCTALYKLFDKLRLRGLYALSITLPLAPVSPRDLEVITSKGQQRQHDVDRTEVAKVLKSASYAGNAFIMFERDVTEISSTWSVRLHQFKRTRLEIGVATCDAFRFCSVERAPSCSFDCFGRASCGGRRRTFGRVMHTGDTVSVVYDISRGVVAFSKGGLSMGALRVDAPRDVPLYPFIYFPAMQGEAVSKVKAGSSVIDLEQLHVLARQWKQCMQVFETQKYDAAIASNRS